MRIKEGAKAARLRLGRFRAKVLYEKNIGEERRYSTEVRKVQSPTININKEEILLSILLIDEIESIRDRKGEFQAKR